MKMHFLTEIKIASRFKMRIGRKKTVILWMSKISALKTEYPTRLIDSINIFPSGIS